MGRALILKGIYFLSFTVSIKFWIFGDRKLPWFLFPGSGKEFLNFRICNVSLDGVEE